jgi:uncharacterized membrane protein
MSVDHRDDAMTGGPASGRHAAIASASGLGRWAALGGSAIVLALASFVAAGLGLAAKYACWADHAWLSKATEYQARCYTDIYPLYRTEGLAAGQVPYFHHHVEYPVVIGAVMQGAAWVARSMPGRDLRAAHFFYVTVILLALCLVVGVLATAYCAGPGRRWTALLVAFSPALILSAFINWDLIAMALMMVSLAAWTARRLVLAGVLLGLAVATKFYPVVMLWPLFLLCLRAGRLRAFAVTTGSALVAWLAVNLPVALAAPQGWAFFYSNSSHRPADWGGIWRFFEYVHWPVVGTMSTPSLNLQSVLAFAIATLAIGLLAMAAPRRPRLIQLVFLITAAFLLCNKVWSPQYVIWLVPLVVLARPRLPAYLVWQAAEVVYFYAVWGFLIDFFIGMHTPGSISNALYFTTLLARFGTVLLLCALVVRDCLRPDRDIVRSGGIDDPSGGVLAGAPDRLSLNARLRRRAAPAQPAF